MWRHSVTYSQLDKERDDKIKEAYADYEKALDALIRERTRVSTAAWDAWFIATNQRRQS